MYASKEQKIVIRDSVISVQDGGNQNNPKAAAVVTVVRMAVVAVARAGVAQKEAPCVRIDVASFKETLLAYRGRNEENDDNLSRRIQSQDHCPDAAAA